MRKFLDKFVNLPRLVLTLWILLWAVLVILLIMKYCFNIWYPIVVKNEIFTNICDFVNNSKFFSTIIMILFYVLNGNLIFLSSTLKRKYNKRYLFLIFCGCLVGGFFLKRIHNALGLAFEISVIVFAIIYNLKYNVFYKKWLSIIYPIIVYALINFWQLLILLVRGLNLEELSNNYFLIGVIMQLDYYIFLTLLWIGGSFMGLWGFGWLWSKEVTELKALREKEMEKSQPNQTLIAEINRAIEKKLNENESK